MDIKPPQANAYHKEKDHDLEGRRTLPVTVEDKSPFETLKPVCSVVVRKKGPMVW